jgi:prepilin peptidase CpaA
MINGLRFSQNLIIPVALAVTLICVYTDCRSRTIKNSVTFPAMALGLLLNALGSGWPGLLFAFAGLLAGIALMLIPFLYGQMGAGDVKLMGALGSLLGGYGILNVFLYTTIAGGILALGFAAYHKNLISTFKKLWLLVKCLVWFRSPAAGKAVYDKSIPMPYGLAIGIGAVTFLTAGRIV